MRKVLIDLELIVEIVQEQTPLSEHYLDIEKNRIIEIPYNVFEAIEEDYYDELNMREMELVEVARAIYEGSNRYIKLPRLTDADYINVLLDISSSLDEGDSLRDVLIDAASGNHVSRKIRYLIKNVPGFYDLWSKHLAKYVREKIQAWARSIDIEFFEL